MDYHNIKVRAGPVAPPTQWVEQATRLSRPATGRTERSGAPISTSSAGLHVARASRLRIPAPSPCQEPSRRNPVSSPKNIKNREITLFTPHRAGMPACSRWLSGAKPPEPIAPNPPAPRPGCQPHHYTIRSSPKNIKNPRNNTFYALNHTLCSGLRLSETSRSARIVASHPDATWGPFVPSVPLDTANSSKIPEITLLTLHPGGMPACSRWLSRAIPPDPAPQSPALRQECQPSLRLPLGSRNPRVAKPTVCGRQNAHSQPKNSKNPRNNTFYALKQSRSHPPKCLPERPPANPYRLLKPEAS